MSNGLWASLTGVFGCIIYFAILATCFFIVGGIANCDRLWMDWFGFVCWAQMPLAPVEALDVLLVAADWDGAVLYIFSVGSTSS